MSTKHTPGPWDNDLAEHEQPYQDILIRAGSRTICRVWIDDAPCHDYNAEQIANARLIAAAPELLKALKAILADGLHCDVVPHLHEKARAAIAKAEGGAA